MKSVVFSTMPELGKGCAHLNRVVLINEVAALHATELGGPQIVATTGPLSLALAGPCMCAAVTLPLRCCAYTLPKTVTTWDAGWPNPPSMREMLRVPIGFNIAFAAEPVAWSRAKALGASNDQGIPPAADVAFIGVDVHTSFTAAIGPGDRLLSQLLFR